MIDLKELKIFLLKANMPHADGTAHLNNETNGSRTIIFSEGDWSMEDNFFGGEPYGGQQVIFYQNEPVWLCVYYGRVLNTQLPPKEVYGFLREALQRPNPDKPQRGPDTYKKNQLEYRNKLEGKLDNYFGREVINENGKEIYWARYMGGVVDQRFKGEL